MRRGLSLFGVAVFLLMGSVMGAGAQEEGHQGDMPPMGAPEEMAALEQYNGVWDVDFKFKMTPTAEEWTETNALSTIKMILDGAVQQLDFSGEMMGMKFVGQGLYAYDRENKSWQNTWVDNFGARISVYSGVKTDEGFAYTGTESMQGAEVHYRFSTSMVADGKFDWTMEMSMDGENYMTTGLATYTKR